MKQKIRVAVLGATGTVGQKLLRRLDTHPWFEISALVASPRSVGKRYAEAVHWLEPVPIPMACAGMRVQAPEDDLACDLALSALDRRTAASVEPEIAGRGIAIVSNASALRMAPGVPLIVPEVNPDHLEVVENRTVGRGIVVTNPNCATIGLVLALKPLVDACGGIRSVRVTTLQAVSGAGHPGAPSLDILGNVLPNIPGEEAKLEEEPQKIFGQVDGGDIRAADFSVSAQTNRVPVVDGHVLSVAVDLPGRPDPEEARRIIDGFESAIGDLELPSAPRRPVRVVESPTGPQPRLHCFHNGGMTVSVGRVRRCPALGLQLVALVHNTERGAAGAAMLNAELLLAKGLI